MLSVGYMHSFKYLGVYLRNKLDWTVTRDLSLHLSRSNGFSRVSARMLTKLKSIEDNISQPLQHSVETLSSSGADYCTLSARRKVHDRRSFLPANIRLYKCTHHRAASLGAIKHFFFYCKNNFACRQKGCLFYA